MSQNKIIRSLCYFTDAPSPEIAKRASGLAARAEAKGYWVQTKRLCAPVGDLTALHDAVGGGVNYLSIGTIPFDQAKEQLPKLFKHESGFFNIDLTHETIEKKHVDILFEIIRNNASRTFNFTYVFNNSPSSPFFPSGAHERNGFSIGLQPTDLSVGCTTLEEWLQKMKMCWVELHELFGSEQDFLGIDSSTAPLVTESGSMLRFVKQIAGSFGHSVTTDTYTTITRFIKEENPKPTGLCGLMFPCLEDTELAAEYEKGDFSIERNIYLSLHSGLGIDTYPIGIDEKPERVVEILRLLRALSNKYSKPLSARFVSDGKAKIGERTDYKNQYLADCTIRAL